MKQKPDEAEPGEAEPGEAEPGEAEPGEPVCCWVADVVLAAADVLLDGVTVTLTVTLREGAYILLLVGLNCAVNMVSACNSALVDALPLLIGTGVGLTVPPPNVTSPIALDGKTLALSVIEVPAAPLGGFAVSLILVGTVQLKLLVAQLPVQLELLGPQ